MYRFDNIITQKIPVLPAYSWFKSVSLEVTLIYLYVQGLGLKGHGPVDMQFSIESRVGFNSKVFGEGDMEVVMEGKVDNMERKIGYFTTDYGL